MQVLGSCSLGSLDDRMSSLLHRTDQTTKSKQSRSYGVQRTMATNVGAITLNDIIQSISF